MVRRHVPGAFCGFDFRLRCLAPAGPIPEGGRLTWSCVFPLNARADIPPEGFLQLPQKQGFKPAVFLEPKSLTLAEATIEANRDMMVALNGSDFREGVASFMEKRPPRFTGR